MGKRVVILLLLLLSIARADNVGLIAPHSDVLLVYNLDLVEAIEGGKFIGLSRFIDDQGLQRCQRNLIAADEDEDGKLTPDEYALFIAFQSTGNYDHLFEDLSFLLVATYYAVACQQCYDRTQSELCCIGTSAFIDLENGELYDPMTAFLCSTVNDSLEELMTPTAAPTPIIPSTSPAPVTPSVGPTGQPTTLPTGVPTFAPTKSLPTRVPTTAPTPSPTRRPTTSPTNISTSLPTRLQSALPTASPTPATQPTTLPTAASLRPIRGPTAPSPEAAPFSVPSVPVAVPTMAPVATPVASPMASAAPSPATAPAATPTGMPFVAPSTDTPATSVPPTTAPTATPSTQAPVSLTPVATPSTVAPESSTPATTPSTEIPAPATPTGRPSPVAPVPSGSLPSSLPVAEQPSLPPVGVPTPATGSSLPTAVPVATIRPTTTTSLPTALITPSPTQLEGSKLCVTFFYTIQNSAGLTAEDLFNEVNNTVKTGLELATRNVTIELLNETFPRSTSTASANIFEHAEHRHVGELTGVPLTYTGGMERSMENAMIDMYGEDQATGILNGFIATLYLPSSQVSSQTGHIRRLQSYRRLVFYTDTIPLTITDIVKDPFCPQADELKLECAIVVTDVCVVLESGDDAELIREVLVDGLRQAVDSGALFERIPPDHLP